MRIELLFVGKTKERYLAAGIDDYLKRLGHFVPLDVRIVRERRGKKSDSAASIVAAEGKLLLGERASGALLVALDVGGRPMSSEELAARLSGWEEQGRKTISFAIGGPLGLAPAVVEAADLVLSLSAMTLTHEMARLLLAEQLYRAYTIKAGTGYHK